MLTLSERNSLSEPFIDLIITSESLSLVTSFHRHFSSGSSSSDRPRFTGCDMHVWLWALVNEDEGRERGDRGRVESARPSVQDRARATGVMGRVWGVQLQMRVLAWIQHQIYSGGTHCTSPFASPRIEALTLTLLLTSHPSPLVQLRAVCGLIQ